MALLGVHAQSRPGFIHPWSIGSLNGHVIARRAARGHGPRCEAVKKARQAPAPPVQPTPPSETTPAAKLVRRHRTVLPCRSGGKASVTVHEEVGSYSVTIQLRGGPLDGHPRPPTLLWGVYRGSARRWQHPEGCVPSGSTLDERSGAMRSPFGPDGCITLRFPARLAPATLAWVGVAGGRAVLPLVARHFAVPLGTLPGSPVPLGPSAVPGAGVNFSVRSTSARGVCLLLFRRGAQGTWTKAMELELDGTVNRTGDTWHITLPTLSRREGLAYAWRLDGEVAWDAGNRTQPDRLLLDPAAPGLAISTSEPAGLGPLRVPSAQVDVPDGAPLYLLSSLATLDADVEGSRPPPAAALPALQQRCAVVVDVRASASAMWGGVLDQVEEFKALGFNTVVLTSCYATAWAEPVPGSRGRVAVSYWAPDPTLALAPDDAARELQALVSGLHAAGLAVLMQVDFTFTAEGSDAAPCALSLRGLDYAVYYRRSGVLNAEHSVVRQYILDVLRHWALDYGMDGFVFLGAENLVQDRDGVVLDAPPLAGAIVYDPVLSGRQFVATTADKSLLPREGIRGFPHWGQWQESNGDLSAALLPALCGTGPARPAALREALCASPLLFGSGWELGVPGNLATQRPPCACFQALAPLPADLEDTAVKTALLVTLCALGTPAVSLADVERHARFVATVTRLRRRWASLLLPSRFDAAERAVYWHGASPGSEPDWDGTAAGAGILEAGFLAMSVYGPGGAPALYLAINASDYTVTAALPDAPARHPWKRAVDTGLDSPEDAIVSGGAHHPYSTYTLRPKAALLLVAEFEPSTWW